MKGATAEPFTNTRSPPSANMARKMGSSQNFLRTRMKRQSSTIRLIDGSLKPVGRLSSLDGKTSVQTGTSRNLVISLERRVCHEFPPERLSINVRPTDGLFVIIPWKPIFGSIGRTLVAA